MDTFKGEGTLENTEIDSSSDDSKNMIGNPEELKYRKLMRERLQTTSIPKL